MRKRSSKSLQKQEKNAGRRPWNDVNTPAIGRGSAENNIKRDNKVTSRLHWWAPEQRKQRSRAWEGRSTDNNMSGGTI